ncbi:MAG: type II toxin-antitoxin system MqsA family antitoxin [Deltaproteobacteria bacterium]|nr:type II toxin-antitoxin system MqsA family antitoxin [Deltaproteobacteria bacterium]
MTLTKGTATLVFKDVPADVCDHCGEDYIGEDVARRLYSAAEAIVRSGVPLDVRSYEAA